MISPEYEFTTPDGAVDVTVWPIGNARRWKFRAEVNAGGCFLCEKFESCQMAKAWGLKKARDMAEGWLAAIDRELNQ